MGEMASSTAYTVICLSISAFALTSLDTATRLGRFLFQELFAGNSKENKNAVQKVLSNMYVATLITIFFGALLCLGGYANIWPLFGACNQLVAVPAFLAVTVWLARQKKNNKMFYFPMIFMLCATLSSLVISFMNNMKKFEAGTAVFIKEGLQCIITVPIFVLAVILVIEGVKVLIQLNNEKKAND